MQKYIKDLKSSDFEKKFLSNTVIGRDDVKYALNSRINGKTDDRSEKIMSKLKALVYVHNGDNIMPIRRLYKAIRDRDVKLSELSAKLKEISDMSHSKFEDKFTDAINFSQNGIVNALEHKINKIRRIRSASH
jgi:hypothetical protein